MKRTKFSAPTHRGVPSSASQERKITDLIYHTRDLLRRNYLLQESLDRANARIAKMQTASMQ